MTMGDGTGDAGARPFSGTRRAMLLDEPRTELVLVRHAQQVEPEPGAAPSDSYDRPLSARGRRQAQLVARALQDEGFDAVYCSALSRARDTAAAVCNASPSGLWPVVLAELNEVEVFGGVPAGSTVGEIMEEAALEDALGAFRRTRRWDALPFTEDSVSLRNRAWTAIRTIAESHPGGRVCVVAHGGVLNAFFAEVLSSALDMLFQPAHASVARVFHWGNTWALQSLNEQCHLSEEGESLVTY
jgi:probable phosphoglycerate mutase